MNIVVLLFTLIVHTELKKNPEMSGADPGFPAREWGANLLRGGTHPTFCHKIKYIFIRGRGRQNMSIFFRVDPPLEFFRIEFYRIYRICRKQFLVLKMKITKENSLLQIL